MVNNFGTTQSSIGQLLQIHPGEQFWVNAKKEAGSQYRYEGEEPHIYHLPPGAENQQGDCLTYGSLNGGLITKVRQRDEKK